MSTTRLQAFLFLLVWASCAWFGSWELNPNNATRMFAALSIVEDGDATIDEWSALTIDKAVFDGHLYLDKAPGMTLMALPAVAVTAALSPVRSRDYAFKTFGNVDLARFLRLRVRLASATGPALLTALAAVLLFDMGLALTGSARGALAAALAYALGTPAWGWSTTIMGHAPVAALLVIALWAGWRGSGDARIRFPIVLGASLGWAVVVEYQAVLAGSALALWAAWRVWGRPWRWSFLLAASAAGVTALIPLVGYNLFAFGTPLRVGYQGVVGFEGMNQGLFGLGVPSADVLWEILFGTRRGLIWVAPVLVLAPLGYARMTDPRDLGRIAGVVGAVVLLVNAAYVYWDGGNATGPRHAIPLVGVAALGIAGLWRGLTRAGRWATIGLIAGSIAINLAIASAEIFAPPSFTFELAAVWDRFAAGDLRTVASEWWGWSPWTGLTAWLAFAGPLSALLVAGAVRRDCA